MLVDLLVRDGFDYSTPHNVEMAAIALSAAAALHMAVSLLLTCHPVSGEE